MKECPFCAEQIQDKAIKCRYCKEWLDKKEGDTHPSAAAKTDKKLDVPENCSCIKVLSGISEEDIPFFVQALEKYFEPEVLNSASSPIADRHLVLTHLLHIEQPKALEAVMKIFGILKHEEKL